MARGYRRIASQEAKRAGLRGRNRRIFLRQMRQEAGFRDATSPAGAQGPAQIMPATARAWGVRNVHDPHEAYGAAARADRRYLKSYGGSWAKALTAYNAGPGRVGGALPAETRNYISTILGGRDTHAGRIRSGGRTSMTPDRFVLGKRTTFDQQGYEQARRRSLVAGFLQRSGRGNSILFRSGLLSTEAPDASDFTKSRLTSKIVKGSIKWNAPDGSHVAAPIHDGGGYAGTEGLARSSQAFARGFGVRPGSQKRATVNTASGNVSDHYVGNKTAYATDFPAVGKTGDRLAARFAKRYGLSGYRKGTITNGTIRVGKRRYRVQLIWGTSDHLDHVHLGFRRIT